MSAAHRTHSAYLLLPETGAVATDFVATALHHSMV